MGKTWSRCTGRYQEGEEEGFQEDERRKTRDGGQEEQRRRRRSSGLSRYSTDFQHVIEEPLKIAAFNVRRFGTAKMKDNNIVDILEIVDTSEKAVSNLIDAVNKKDGGDNYKIELSPRVGRNNQKEQYGFIYRTTKVSVEESCIYPDPDDVFIREPFIAKFSTKAAANINSFTVIAIHTQPKNAAAEIDHLADVHLWTEKRMKTENIIIAGDLNAGGQFVRPSDWVRCRLRAHDLSAGDTVYHWLVPDHMDTTATNTLAAYDRIIACGDSTNECVVPGSAGVFRFDEEFGLDEKTTLQVSDHYPVFCHLRPTVHQTVRKYIQTRSAILVSDKRLPGIDFESLILSFKMPKMKIRSFYENNGSLTKVEMRSRKLSSVEETLTVLTKLRESFPALVTFSCLATLKYKLQHLQQQERDSKEFYLVTEYDLTGSKSMTIQVQISTNIV